MSDTVPETEIPEVAEAEAAVEVEVEVEAGLAGEPEYDPAAPAPLNVPRTPTGNADVDAQLERLGDADHLATDGHLEVYEDVHRGLRDALTALDARPGPPAPSSPPSPYGNRS
ncbi:hypothetical protein [Streptomyces sp. AS02]|uniref:hypothetical protein n=1 Tax=Streptomyces sp. AS02 TaxID=2938946 RepID=UPI002021C5B8|nr:hypothetical protein [Streptomyces sp. AS02]MCL8012202.1 hypothetical protein [Streptomyces sp. AS02]